MYMIFFKLSPVMQGQWVSFYFRKKLEGLTVAWQLSCLEVVTDTHKVFLTMGMLLMDLCAPAQTCADFFWQI